MEEVLGPLFDGSHEAILVVGRGRRVVYVNPVMCSFLDTEADKVIGLPVSEVEGLEFVLPHVEEMARSRKRTPRKTLHFPRSEIGRDADILVILDPVRLARRKYTLLRLLENMPAGVPTVSGLVPYDWVMDSLIDGVIIDDPRGRIVYANRAFANMLGVPRSELIGQRWVQYMENPDEDLVFEKVALRRLGESERYEINWRRADGTLLQTLVSAAPFRDKSGAFSGSVAVVTDITELKEAEKTVKFFVDLLTHDLSNQLQVIMTATGLLDEELPASYIDDARASIVEAVERCNRLIAKVKRAAKVRELPITDVNLAEVLAEKVRAVERVYEAQVEVEDLSEPIYVRANSLLGEMIWNLLENAARHNPRSDRRIWVSGKRAGEYFALVIADNGPGISDTRKATLFQKTRDYGGVGLTLVAHIVRESGGRIEVADRVEGSPDKGAKFTLYLPLAE